MWSSEEHFVDQTRKTSRRDLAFQFLSPRTAAPPTPPPQQPPPPSLPPPTTSFSILTSSRNEFDSSDSGSNPHRLSPRVKRHKNNTAFAIVAEYSPSNPGTRTPSPTPSGRVSPFRGRGFNPIGSRHASPLPSPPRLTSPTLLPPASATRVDFVVASAASAVRRSRIPTFRRNSSTESSGLPSPTRRAIPVRTGSSSGRPPPSPRETPSTRRRRPPRRDATPGAFQKLSPIAGSSSEPSSPSGGNGPSPLSAVSERSRGGSSSDQASRRRTVSGTPPAASPTLASPSRRFASEAARYARVKSKVDSFNRRERTTATVTTRTTTTRPASNKPQVPDAKTTTNDVFDVAPDKVSNPSTTNSEPLARTEKNGKNSSSEASERHPQAATVVSSTTSAASGPLKIDAVPEVAKITSGTDDDDDDRGEEYMPTARTLSATSVSTALNRMSDTVIDSDTLMKESSAYKNRPIYQQHQQQQQQNQQISKIGLGADVVDKLPAVDVTSLPSALPSLAPSKNPVSVVVAAAVENNGAGRLIEEKTELSAPIKITVREKAANGEVESGNVRLQAVSIATAAVSSPLNGSAELPRLPPQPPPAVHRQESAPDGSSPDAEGAAPPFRRVIASRLAGFFRRKKNRPASVDKPTPVAKSSPSPNRQVADASSVEASSAPKKSKFFLFRTAKTAAAVPETTTTELKSDEPTTKSTTSWHNRLLSRFKRNKVADVVAPAVTSSSDVPLGRPRLQPSVEFSIDGADVPPAANNFSRSTRFWRALLCRDYRERRHAAKMAARRRSLPGKKKSLTPSIQVEEPKPKLEAGLVEHMSLMKGAIPVLSLPLAWLCLALNVFLPGVGTIVSGFLCLCTGKPRFSPTDGVKQRIGACIIDFFIGAGQLFTVLFCLVGWGWSIWWGVIMIKLARKYRKIKLAEKAFREDEARAAERAAAVDGNHLDVERGHR